MDYREIKWMEAPPEQPGGEKHLNCFQRTLMANCDILGISQAQCEQMGAYFGGGMGCGGTCGPVNATLLLLGQLFGDDPTRKDAGKEFLVAFAKANGGSWLCSDIRDEDHVRCEAAIAFAAAYIEKLVSRKPAEEN